MDSIFDGKSVPVIRTNDCIFLNSDTLFVEYSDILRCIDFTILLGINRNKEGFESLLDLSPIDGLNINSMWEWYVKRKNKNILVELLRKDQIPNIEKLDKLLSDLVEASGEEGVSISQELHFMNVLRNISKEDTSFVSHIKVWYPFENKAILSDIQSTFDKRVIFVSGDLQDVIKDIPNNSTFVFSDISNILVMADMNKLKYSSILLPNNFRYNQCDDKNLKLDLEKYTEEEIFKVNFFSNV